MEECTWYWKNHGRENGIAFITNGRTTSNTLIILG